MEKEVPLPSFLRTDKKNGLSSKEAAKRVAAGENHIERKKTKSTACIFLAQFDDVLCQVLAFSALLSALISIAENGVAFYSLAESFAIILILLVNAAIATSQEISADKALDTLKQYASESCRVIRDGRLQIIPSRHVVPGDLLELHAGDKVPADGICIAITGSSFSVDQALVTGESVPVEKTPSDGISTQNMLYAGVVVSRGSARALVTKTGRETLLGSIQTEIEDTEKQKTPLAVSLDDFGKRLSGGILGLCVVIFAANFVRFGISGRGVVGATVFYLKGAISLAVAAIPEGLSTVLTAVLACSAQRMAKKNTIVRRLSAIETLGCTSVICTDKTGTITAGQMAVVKLAVNSAGMTRTFTVDGTTYFPQGMIHADTETAPTGTLFDLIGAVCSLCTQTQLVWDKKKAAPLCIGDPTEAALLVLAEKIGAADHSAGRRLISMPPEARIDACRRRLNTRFELVHVVEFTREKKTMSVVCRCYEDEKHVLFLKGAFEVVLARAAFFMDVSGAVVRMDDGERRRLADEAVRYAQEQCLRVLALAMRSLTSSEAVESELVFLCLVGVTDPPRKEIREAVETCRQAGIRTVVVTGDAPQTAAAVCLECGIANGEHPPRSHLGDELDAMDEETQRTALISGDIFSRVHPRHKSMLVRELKRCGEIVAMTGDGVNDAPALKEADIGVSMGSGSDVARLSSDFILVDNNFHTIVAAIEEGRDVYIKIKLFLRYLISSNIGEVVCILFASLCGIPEILTSSQLLWINLVTDGLPAAALGFGAADNDLMAYPPRSRKERLISAKMLFRYMLVGVYVGAATIVGYFLALKGRLHSAPCEKRAKSVSLSILVVAEMLNALNCLSETKSLLQHSPCRNIFLLAAIATSLLLHFCTLYIPLPSAVFGTVGLCPREWGCVLLLSSPVILIEEAYKAGLRHTCKNSL
eukprot:GHVN01002509.1.p1 GENE.GHVN01002509.1~~GHVN01002509.1.p1  ORF type:complete len:931 (-),score=78.75 GHVN01002509.1:12-2804(-)